MQEEITNNRGILSRLKSRLQRNRLGELLVLDGVLSDAQLQQALKSSKESHKPLGHVLVEDHMVSSGVIRRTLMEQFTLRIMMAGVAVFISIASMGFAKQARAGQIKDAPAKISLVQASFASVASHPKIFNSVEKKSHSLKAFTKWINMFDRFDASLNQPNAQKHISQLRGDLQAMKGLPLNRMASKVNDLMNSKRYITDAANYGKTDYWATPVEFLSKGGDCEDFAIAKYTALRILGVPEDRMRIAIVQDLQKNVPHAVLIVYTDNGPMLLDNQIKTTVAVSQVQHYKPIFSINQQAWWLHSAPQGNTVVASSVH